jgi:hypothetical protein
MLNDDVISLIKEYAGITSLDIVNVYYELNTDSPPNITRIQTLVKWIPILYKPDKKYRVSNNEDPYLEHYIGDEVKEIDALVAFKLLYPMKLIKGIPWFQATRKTSYHIAKFIKKELNHVSPLYKIVKKRFYYINGMVTHRLIGQCSCGKTKRLDDYYNDVMTCHCCIGKSIRHMLKRLKG